jgi:hypothetical protein
MDAVPPQIPAHPLTMLELGKILTALHTYLQENAPGSKEAALRGNAYRRAREAYQCFLFSVGYSALFGVHPSLQVQIKEEIDYDAILTWRNGCEAQKMRLQLKELVSSSVNPKAESADKEMEKIVSELPRAAPDLTVAIFANYGVKNILSFKMPSHVKNKELWVFGFSKEKGQELIITGGDRGKHKIFVPVAAQIAKMTS